MVTSLPVLTLWLSDFPFCPYDNKNACSYGMSLRLPVPTLDQKLARGCLGWTMTTAQCWNIRIWLVWITDEAESMVTSQINSSNTNRLGGHENRLNINVIRLRCKKDEGVGPSILFYDIMPAVFCTLPAPLQLVWMLFGRAIPTSSYILTPRVYALAGLSDCFCPFVCQSVKIPFKQVT